MAAEEDILLVVAFDVGTAFSGFAYSFTTDESKIFLNKPWKGLDTYKTSTSVLLKDGKFDSFGFDAEKKYAGLKPEKQKAYQLFDKFKMTLDKENLYGEPVRVISRTGEETNGIEIFAFALKDMKKRLETDIAERHWSYNKDCNVRWVITVPAIWSEGAKQFMRKVAVQAGIIDSLDSPRLVIALEPEAASLYFRNLTIHKCNPETKGQTLPKGTEYVILDCGGGTIDIVAHKVIEKGCVKEIFRATGGPWGGMNVNQNYEQLIRKVLGSDFIDHYAQTQPGDWFEFLTEFEKKKREISSQGESLGISISIVMLDEFSTFAVLQSRTVHRIQDAIANANVSGVFYSGGKLVVEGEALDNLFTSVVDKIIDHLTSLLQEDTLKNVTHIILVGGFSNSPYLKNAVKNKFEERTIGEKYRVLPAEGAEVAVLNGAVMYGQHPPTIESRKARYTYGYDVNLIFESHHDESRKTFNKYRNKYYCKDCFQVLIKRGESVNFGEVRTGFCNPTSPDQTKLTYKFLAIDNEKVTYADEDGVKELGRLTIHSTNKGKGINRSFKCDFTFGGTEIKVRVTEEGANTEEKTTLDLHGNCK